jgi:acyl homoserine lactone synthase
MLKLIEGSYASFFPKEIDAMFRNRAETFSRRLGWEVIVKDGYIESATIWEVSRICATAVVGQPDRSTSCVNYVLSELILGIGEVSVAAGLTQIVAVFDARFLRILHAAGCNPQIIGKPQRIGETMSYAGVFDTGEGPLNTFRAALGIDKSVLAPGAKEIAFA